MVKGMSASSYAMADNIIRPIANAGLKYAERTLIPIKKSIRDYVEKNVCKMFSITTHFDSYISKCITHILSEKYLKPKYGNVLIDVDPAFAMCAVSMMRLGKKASCYPELVNKTIGPGVYSVVLDADLTKMVVIRIPQEASESTQDMGGIITHYQTVFIFIGKNRDKWYTKLRNEIDTAVSKIVRSNQGGGKIKCHSMESSENQNGGSPERQTVPMSMLSFPAKEDLLKKINNFIAEADLYKQLQIAHRLGILLSGKPGTGKTMFAFSLAAHLDMECVSVNLDYFDKCTGDNAFDGSNTVYVIDEIDSQLVNRATTSAEQIHKDLKISRRLYMLLRAMDTMGGGSIVVATTNYPERLDPALKRSGRFDIIQDMDDLDEEYAIKMVTAKGIDPKKILADVRFPINPAMLEQKIVYSIMMEKGIGAAKKIASFDELGLKSSELEEVVTDGDAKMVEDDDDDSQPEQTFKSSYRVPTDEEDIDDENDIRVPDSVRNDEVTTVDGDARMVEDDDEDEEDENLNF